jgi:hypothetical protein
VATPTFNPLDGMPSHRRLELRRYRKVPNVRPLTNEARPEVLEGPTGPLEDRFTIAPNRYSAPSPLLNETNYRRYKFGDLAAAGAMNANASRLIPHDLALPQADQPLFT